MEHFVSDSIFKRLNFDYSSSITVLIQRIKFRAIFSTGDQINQCEFNITKYNKIRQFQIRSNKHETPLVYVTHVINSWKCSRIQFWHFLKLESIARTCAASKHNASKSFHVLFCFLFHITKLMTNF